MNMYEQAAERLRKEFDKVKGSKAAAMKKAVRDALLSFAKQEEEFAQAIVQGGSFSDCMAQLAAGVGKSISDLEAFEKATRFYFPGARVRFEMHVDLIGDAAVEGTLSGAERQLPRRGSQGAGKTEESQGTGTTEGKAAGGGLVLDLADFL